MSKNKNELSCRLGRVGGQAVLEGVMMKAGDRTVTSCRKADGTIYVHDDTFTSVRTKNKFLNLPIIRGVVNFIEMMKLSVGTMTAAAEALGLEEEEETKFEKWLAKKLGANIDKIVMAVAMVLAVVLSLFLSMIPILIVFAIFSEQIMQNMSVGGLKG